jgi:DNA-binding GntR family transcriptional regulator
MAGKFDSIVLPFSAKSKVREARQTPPSLIETSSLADEIAFRLESAIVAQQLPPGTRLRQEELCERFGVSRTPIREALRKLQAQRLVVLTPNKGATVRIPTRKEIEEVYELRGELEGFAAELACKFASAESDLELARTIEVVKRRKGAPRNRDIGDSTFNIDVSGAIRSFHHVIHEMAGNQRLASTIKELEKSFPGDFCSHEMARPTDSKRLHIDDHVQIRDAIRARDPVRARSLMKNHIERAKDILLTYLDERGFWRNS